jgi:hypothetical protein
VHQGRLDVTRRGKAPPPCQGWSVWPLVIGMSGRVFMKKNRVTIGRTKAGRGFIIASQTWKQWAAEFGRAARDGLPTARGNAWGFHPSLTLARVQVTAVYSPPDRRGWPDLSAFLESIGDALQLAGVVENDRQIASWDGSRILDPDTRYPDGRLDVLITPMLRSVIPSV